jgi:hypothetical protein
VGPASLGAAKIQVGGRPMQGNRFMTTDFPGASLGSRRCPVEVRGRRLGMMSGSGCRRFTARQKELSGEESHEE